MQLEVKPGMREKTASLGSADFHGNPKQTILSVATSKTAHSTLGTSPAQAQTRPTLAGPQRESQEVLSELKCTCLTRGQTGMAQFKQWALEYVLSDDETAQLDIAKKAAKGKNYVDSSQRT
jgi:hypothetical protein